MDIEEYARSTKNTSLWPRLKKRAGGMGRNQMLYDFGIHPIYYDNPIKIKKAIENLDNYFHFVMITEYFDESLVILRHILCWEVDDVISLAINARMDTYKRNLSDEAVKYLKEWNRGDEMLYEHFLKKFKQTISELGKDRLEYEVRQLRQRRKEWQEYCVEQKVGAKNLTAFRIWSNKVTGYKIKPDVKNETCQDLVKPENYFTSEIRQKQLLRSIMKGAKVPTYGPKSLNHLLDIKYLKGHDQEVARKLLENQYKYNQRRFSLLKEKMKN